MARKRTTNQMPSEQPGAARSRSAQAAPAGETVSDKPKKRRRSRLDRRIDALIAEHPHWSNHRRVVSRIARLILRQEVLDKELKRKGLLRKSDGAPKDALELDFKIESFIRRYLDMLPDAVQAGGQHQRNELIITNMRSCPRCGKELLEDLSRPPPAPSAPKRRRMRFSLRPRCSSGLTG